MNIIEATKLIQEGKHVKRKCWNEGDYACKEVDSDDVYLCLDGEPIFFLGCEDILAEDWQKVV